MKCKVLIISSLFSFVLGIQAQTGKLFDADKQLSSSFTNQVYLDHNGFIWVATRNGLSRYDGYQFLTFKKERGSGLASNYVNRIMQDHAGLFYIGMFGALQTYDGTAFRDVTVKDLAGHATSCYITSFAERKDGEMLIGTSGNGLLRMVNATEARQIGGELSEVKTVHRLMTDSKGRIWIVTANKGLLVWDGRQVVARYFTDSENASNVRRVCQDAKGYIYAGLAHHGLFRLEADGFHHIAASGQKSITALHLCHHGRLLVGYDGNGVGVLNTETGQMTDNPWFSREVDIAQTKVVSVAEDNGGNIWLGMLQKGLYMQPTDSSDFGYMGYKLGSRNTIGNACVTSTLIDRKGHIYVGTDKDGLYVFDANRKLLRHYRQPFPATVLNMCEDHDGHVWIGSYQEGCGWLDNSGTYHPLSLSQGSKVSVFGIGTDYHDNIWFATMGHGLLRRSPDGTITAMTMKDGAAANRSINSIANDYISKMSVSPDGRRVYLATTMGVCCYDVERNSWKSLFGKNCLNYGVATRVVKEFDGSLWIGTNDGLAVYDMADKQLTQLDGFVGVASIEQDQRGRLWISTDHGLYCYNPKSGKRESYFVDNGLQSNEFSDGASCTADGGLMLFGGIGGITWFDPLKIEHPAWKASVRLTEFILNGKPIGTTTRSGNHLVCDTTVIAADRFQLAYHENHFSIQLSTLTYDSPDHIVYIYRINNEPEVRLHPGQNEITFTHLAPGTYRFSIKAERNNQQTAERVFTVVVHAPWYRTWWAYCLYLLVAGAAVWLAIRYRRRKEQDRLRLQEHIHAIEMGEAKMRFFMNISHEIRTPMTLIVTPLLSLMKQDNDPQRQGIYHTIRRNAERILELINQMMDLRKIDKGMMQMRMQETDLISFVNDIYTLFTQQAKAKKILFSYNHDGLDTLPVWIDRNQFDKVIINILSNAFKFTPTGGTISLQVKAEAKTVSISVSDNGEQIPEDRLERIFERFYQSPSALNDRNVGTGIGLNLTRSLVELHHGTISAHNLELGCEFVVTIPRGCNHLTADEMTTEPTDDTHVLQLLEEEPMTGALSEEPKPNRRLTLVIAEDDDEIRDYVTTELSNDYDIISCTNGREALAETLKSAPDLVISDVMMPEMDGTTLCTKLKTNPQTSHIPIILLTAKNRDEDLLEGLEMGADAYLVKPFNMDILRRTIANLISSHRLLRLKYGRNDQLEQQVDDVKMKSPDEKLLERVMAVINRNLSNSDLSVEMIADEVGISRVHLHRKMKELTGQTPHDFIRNLRLKQAANLLSASDMNVTEVVYACGFGNVASFSTTFKKFYGMSPREYMREHQKE